MVWFFACLIFAIQGIIAWSTFWILLALSILIGIIHGMFKIAMGDTYL